tara:strand:- start:10312 stop:10653 length:342 start_codon:yes stop_codon:yes gene_type:complete
MKCAICPREARGFGYNPRLAREDGRPGKACSMKHLNILKEKQGMIMSDATANETEAVMNGGAMGGEYLDWLGKTNLAALSQDEWKQFLFCVVGGYVEKIATNTYLLNDDDIPF